MLSTLFANNNTSPVPKIKANMPKKNTQEANCHAATQNMITTVDHIFDQIDNDISSAEEVLDGASEILIELFGEQGRHARTATGVAQLPYGAAIQLDMVLKLKPLSA